jgi:hypothetical protein
MKIQKKVSMQGDWVKVNEDITDESLITILDGGKEVDGDYGKRLVFSVKTKNGDKIMTFNQTSLNNLVDAYGDDSMGWAGQMAKVYIVKQKVGDKLKNVAYLCGSNWVMLDDGAFVEQKTQAPKATMTNEYDGIPVVEPDEQ